MLASPATRRLSLPSCVLSRRLLLILVSAVALAAGFAARSGAGPDLRPITLIARAGRVTPGEEKQTCHRTRFPRRQEVDVNRVQMFVKGGSHHVHLYRPYGGEVEFPTKDCPFAVDFSKWQLVTASQNPVLDWQLPPGVAINFLPRQPLMIQTHFVNAQALDVRGAAKAKIKLHPMDPSTVTAHGGALFGQDRTVNVPPGDHLQISRCALTGDAASGRQLTIMALTGHYHFRGTEFTVYRDPGRRNAAASSSTSTTATTTRSAQEYPGSAALVARAGRGPRVVVPLPERHDRDLQVRRQHAAERALQPLRLLLPDRHAAGGDRLRPSHRRPGERGERAASSRSSAALVVAARGALVP